MVFDLMNMNCMCFWDGSYNGILLLSELLAWSNGLV